jgi:glucosamine-6-phosphate deaminase
VTPGAFTVDQLPVRVLPDGDTLARAAADDAAATVRDAIARRGVANVMFASGKSQLGLLAALAAAPALDWQRVVGFHMDEYAGLAGRHRASLRRYMRELVAGPLGIGAFHYLDGAAADVDDEARRYAALLREHQLDLCCLGIGENGHLAFNDPPVADFDDPLDVKVASLDDASRRQQVGEGHFAAVDDVPTHAITVTIPALLRARRVLAVVPEARKAEPVRGALAGPVSTACPASILRRQAHAVLYLDRESASLLGRAA